MKKSITVFIPAAGLGSRIKGSNSILPKPLLSIGNQPLIGRVMSLYPSETRFVIGVGYKSDWVKQVASIVALENSQEVKFFETNSWEFANKGLTNTILDSKPYLSGDFIFHAVDSIVPRRICLELMESTENTIVTGVPLTSGVYRFTNAGEWFRGQFDHESTEFVYAGVSFIQNSSHFWKKLEDEAPQQPEAGETLGIDPGFVREIKLISGEWMDSGTQKGLETSRDHFKNPDVVLERSNEAIWNIGQNMYKFHEDKKFISNRIARAKNLYPYVPEVSQVSSNLYGYRRVEGVTLSKAPIESFKEFLEFCKQFWFENLVSTEYEKSRFIEFYKDKSISRINDYLAIDPDYDAKTINGNEVLKIQQLLLMIPWDELSSITPVRAHGDLHPDNVVFNQTSGRFTLLDWRQEIAGETSSIGDLYYELGKILHGLMVDHEIISKNAFEISKNHSDYIHNIAISDKKINWIQEFREFLKANSFDEKRTFLMTGLIFLNIASLHHSPYNKYLFVLGHETVDRSLRSAK